MGPLDPQHHHQALFAFQTHRTIRHGFPNFITMLKSYCQTCGGRGALCHTTSPHGLIPPPIKRSRILVNHVVWLRSVWLRVADLAGKFPFPDILRIPQKQSEKWLFAQPIFRRNQCTQPRDGFVLSFLARSLSSLCMRTCPGHPLISKVSIRSNPWDS